MPSTYRSQVYEQQIAGMFGPTGEVGRFGQRLRRQISNEADRQAPNSGYRSGSQRKLNESNRDGGELRAGRYKIRGYVTNIAGHAEWVALGVPGMIRAKSIHADGKQYMLIPRYKGGTPLRAGGRKLRQIRTVRGQRPNGGTVDNNWLNRAARVVLSREGLR